MIIRSGNQRLLLFEGEKFRTKNGAKTGKYI